MEKKVAIKPFAAQEFEVEVHRLEGRPCVWWVVGLEEAGTLSAPAKVLGLGAGPTNDESVGGELPPVDAVGFLTGDGMWVGAGGVSFLPHRQAKRAE
jgi:hypothetical protein